MCNLSRKMVIFVVIITVIQEMGILASQIAHKNMDIMMLIVSVNSQNIKLGDQMVVHDLIIITNADILIGYDIITSPIKIELFHCLYSSMLELH